jgi:hypothetical protein
MHDARDGSRRIPQVRLVLLLGAAVLALVPTAIAALQQSPVVSVGEPIETSDEIEVPIEIAGANNVGAFQFVLEFDGEVLEGLGASDGGFLASSGRETFCDDPTVDPHAIRFACVTLGDTPPTGAQGDGVLAVVRFRVTGGQRTSFVLDHVKLSRPDGNQIAVGSTVDGSFAPPGTGDSTWMPWSAIVVGGLALIIGVAAAYAVVRRSRISSETARS